MRDCDGSSTVMQIICTYIYLKTFQYAPSYALILLRCYEYSAIYGGKVNRQQPYMQLCRDQLPKLNETEL